MFPSRSLALLFGVSLLGTASGCSRVKTEEKALEPAPKAQGLSLEKFQAGAFQEPGSDVYIFNGDEAAEGLEGLRDVYEHQFQKDDEGTLVMGEGGDQLEDSRVMWSREQRKKLTYCVSTSFGTHYSEVVQAMAEASAVWEATAGVNYIHESAQDADCTGSNPHVLFDVRPIDVPGTYLARAFQPTASRATRNIRIDEAAFGTGSPRALAGLLRHALGHTLGLSHKKLQPEASPCFGNKDWRPLKKAPSWVVAALHYPGCTRPGDWPLALNSDEAAEVTALYGNP